MKTNATYQTERRAQEQSEQVFKAQGAEFNKYIVLRFNGREQVTVFPFAMRHADVFGYMKRECPQLEAVSAGLFIVDNGEVWTTGNSESLNLASRPQDRQAIEALLKSPDRQLWDLVRLSEEAREAARAEMAVKGSVLYWSTFSSCFSGCEVNFAPWRADCAFYMPARFLT